jgi:hypothetical protein
MSNARTQLPQDIAQRYVLLLDPMLGTSPHHFSILFGRKLRHNLSYGRIGYEGR